MITNAPGLRVCAHSTLRMHASCRYAEQDSLSHPRTMRCDSRSGTTVLPFSIPFRFVKIQPELFSELFK